MPFASRSSILHASDRLYHGAVQCAASPPGLRFIPFADHRFDRASLRGRQFGQHGEADIGDDRLTSDSHGP